MHFTGMLVASHYCVVAMNESWVQTNLWFKKLDATGFQRLLLEFVSPTIKELESQDIIKTFHFLFEPDPHFFLRIEPNSPHESERVKQVIKEYLFGIQDLLVAHPEEQEFTSYTERLETMAKTDGLLQEKCSRWAVGWPSARSTQPLGKAGSSKRGRYCTAF